MSTIRRALEPEGHRVRPVTNEAELVTTAAAGDFLILDASQWQAPAIKSLTGRLPGSGLLLVVDGGAPAPSDDETMALATPVDPGELRRLVRLADAKTRRDPQDVVDFDTLFSGTSAPTNELLRQVRLIAQHDGPVCIHGEYGVGRAVVARAIHDRSMRQDQPFVAVNAAAFPMQYLEEHMFGGANPLVGRGDCTLFIDSLSDLGPIAQAHLLRLVDAGVLNIDGAEIPFNTRVIVADDGTKLTASLAAGRLRTELYYQLRVHHLDVPALRERTGDVGAIIARMLSRLDGDGAPRGITAAALAALECHSFPGNFRELAHTLTHARVLAQGAEIDLVHLPLDIQAKHRARGADVFDPATIEALDAVSKRFERAYLLRVLRAVGGNRTRAAKMLDLSRKGLWQKLKAHGIEASEGRDPSDDVVDDE